MWLETIFASVLESADTPSISILSFLLCLTISAALGLLITVLYMQNTRYTKSFVVTLAMLPPVVTMIILMVNGNIGAGVAVAGTFSLVRFRSVPGSAKEIGAIFLAMGTGLAMGMGYVAFAVVFTVLVSGLSCVLTASSFGESAMTQRMLVITTPEDLDYTGVFDDLFAQYTTSNSLERVKTTNMGSLLKLTYQVDLRSTANEKEFIDQLRCRNGNLEIILAKQVAMGAEL